MNKYEYRVSDPVDEVRNRIDDLANRKWYDFSSNIDARLRPEGGFIMNAKWTFSPIRWIETAPAYLTGTISEETGRTLIKTTVRPNSSFVIMFYLIAVLFFVELLGHKSIGGDRYLNLLIFAMLDLVFFAIMQFSKAALKRRFERLLNLPTRTINS